MLILHRHSSRATNIGMQYRQEGTLGWIQKILDHQDKDFENSDRQIKVWRQARIFMNWGNKCNSGRTMNSWVRWQIGSRSHEVLSQHRYCIDIRVEQTILGLSPNWQAGRLGFIWSSWIIENKILRFQGDRSRFQD